MRLKYLNSNIVVPRMNQLTRLKNYQGKEPAAADSAKGSKSASDIQAELQEQQDQISASDASGLVGSLSGTVPSSNPAALKGALGAGTAGVKSTQIQPQLGGLMTRKENSLVDLKRQGSEGLNPDSDDHQRFILATGKDYAASAENLGIVESQLVSGPQANTNSMNYLKPLGGGANRQLVQDARLDLGANSHSQMIRGTQYGGQLHRDSAGFTDGNAASMAHGSFFNPTDDLDSPRTSKLLADARKAAVGARDNAASQQSLINSRSTGGMPHFGANSGDLVPMEASRDNLPDEEEFVDLSSIKHITDLNQLPTIDRKGVMTDDIESSDQFGSGDIFQKPQIGEREESNEVDEPATDIGQIEVQMQDDSSGPMRQLGSNSSPDLMGADDDDDIDAMEKLMRNRMESAKLLVKQQNWAGGGNFMEMEQPSKDNDEHSNSSDLFRMPGESKVRGRAVLPSNAELEPTTGLGAAADENAMSPPAVVASGELGFQTNEVDLDMGRSNNLKSEQLIEEIAVDDVGGQERINAVLQELMAQGEVSEAHLRGLKDEFAAAMLGEDSEQAEQRQDRINQVLDQMNSQDLGSEQTFAEVRAGDSASPPLVSSNHSTPKLPAKADPPVASGKKPSQPVADGPVPKAPHMDSNANEDNDSFHRLYNKEIKVNQDEIPLLLMELTDIAYKFIKKDQFEKAYVLLQKTESVLEVVNLDHSKRDRYFAYITYHNMSMCFQKLGMLEECMVYLKETIAVIERPNFFKDVSICLRMRQSHILCQLKLQLCAILSQTQKHSEAMENAKYSVRLAHQCLRDLYDLCVFYSNKIKFKDDFSSLSLLMLEEEREAGRDSKNTTSELELKAKLLQKNYIREHSPVRDIPFNLLEESISMIERTAIKILPIMKELGTRLAGAQKKGVPVFHNVVDSDGFQATSTDEARKQLKADIQKKLGRKEKPGDKGRLFQQSDDDEETKQGDIKEADIEVKQPQKKTAEKSEKSQAKPEEQVDMRTILGFLNQNEWILNLNIGNIMQIQPVKMRDCLNMSRNEQQLSRESFLEKLQLLIVSYFCVGTEMRFIIQSRAGFMKEAVRKEKELEQEYWHVKALEIATAFLPSECPLFNHILLSYQKYHDPSLQPIKEDEEQEDEIRVLRPLRGIENTKYAPMIREIEANTEGSKVHIDIADIPMSPLSKCFDQRLLPKKVKTTSINLQTDPFEQPKPAMHAKSIGIQEDLKQESVASNPYDNARCQDSETMTDFEGAANPYQADGVNYQESLISQIVNDPKIGDKQAFLTKLISRVSSKDPDAFQGLSGILNTYQNTQAQVTDSSKIYDSGHDDAPLYFDRSDDKYGSHGKGKSLQKPGSSRGSSGPRKFDDVYGKTEVRRGLTNKGKITQSGQIKPSVGVYGKKHSYGKGRVEKFDDLRSFDQKSHAPAVNHASSLYGDQSQDERTVAAAAAHQIVSQSVGQSLSVLSTEHPTKKKAKAHHAGEGRIRDKMKHKKTASITGPNASHQEFISNTNINIMSSGNSQQLLRGTKKGAFEGRKTQMYQASDGLRASSQEQMDQIKGTTLDVSSVGVRKGGKLIDQSLQSKDKHPRRSPGKAKRDKYGINLTNQRPNAKRKTKQQLQLTEKGMNLARPGIARGTNTTTAQLTFGKSQQKSKQKMGRLNGLGEDSLIMDGMDVMSSSEAASNPDPDLHPEPQSSARSDAPAQIAAVRQKPAAADMSTEKAPESDQQMHSRLRKGKQSKARGASSEITNYTSGQSAIKSRHLLKAKQYGKSQATKGQKATGNKHPQSYADHMRMAQKEKSARNKQKGKVLSRKKYGSDRSSNSPPAVIADGQQQHPPMTSFEQRPQTALLAGASGGNFMYQAGYSIGQQAGVSIFDASQQHSLSKISLSQQTQQPPLIANDSKVSVGGVGLLTQDSLQAPTNVQLGNVMKERPATVIHTVQDSNQKVLELVERDATGMQDLGDGSADYKRRKRQQPGLKQESSQNVILGKPLGTFDAPSRLLTKSQNSAATLRVQQAKPEPVHRPSLKTKKSENVLFKLQGLLGTRESRRYGQPRSKSNERPQGPMIIPQKQKRVSSQQSRHTAGLGVKRQSREPSTGTLGKRSRLVNSSKTAGKASNNSAKVLYSRHSANSKYSRISRSKSSGMKSSNKSRSGKSKSISNERRSQNRPDVVGDQRRMTRRQQKLQRQLDDQYRQLQNQVLMSQSQLETGHPNLIANNKHYNKARASQLARNRPKSSLLPEYQRDMIIGAGRAKRKVSRRAPNMKDSHNHSIQDLQRQVIENQLILHNMATQGGQNANMLRHGMSTNALNVESRGMARGKYHNHNNSITQMNNLGGMPHAAHLQFTQTEQHQQTAGNETLMKQMNGKRIGSAATGQQNFNTQVLNKSFLSSGTSGTVRKTAGRPVSKTALGMASTGSAAESNKRQRIIASGSTQDEILNTSAISKQQAKHLMHASSQKFSGIKGVAARNDKKFLSQNPSGKAKALQNLAALHHAISTTTGTTNQTNPQLLSGKTFQQRKHATGHGPSSQQGKRKRRASITQRKKSKNQQMHGQMYNFEQIQQQLEGGMSIGGFDLGQPNADQSMLTDEHANGSLVLHQQTGSNDSGLLLQNFLPPRKNYMPKTTGSQAQLIHSNSAISATKTKVPSLKDLYSLTSKLSKQRRK